MKFFILFVLVGLGHCKELQVLDCTKATIKNTPGLLEATLKLVCVLRGSSSDDKENEAIQEFNSRVNDISAKTGCTAKQLTGIDTDITPLADQTAEDSETILVGKLKQVKIVGGTLDAACALLESVTDSKCYEAVNQAVQNEVSNTADKPVTSVLQLLQCKHKEGNLDVGTVADLLVKSDCLDAIPKESDLKILKSINPITDSSKLFVSNILADTSNLLGDIQCAAAKLLNGLKDIRVPGVPGPWDLLGGAQGAGLAVSASRAGHGEHAANVNVGN